MFTKAQMEQVLENLDRRLRSVEQKLPTLATNQGLYALEQRVEELSRVELEAMRHEFKTHTEWVDEQFSAVHRRFDSVDHRLDVLTQQTTGRFDRLETLLTKRQE